MSDNTTAALTSPTLTAQPDDVRGLPIPERDSLIISAKQIDGQWVILSRYGEDTWHLNGFASNTIESHKQVNFSTIPPMFRAVIKAALYRYLQRGLPGAGRPKGATVRGYFNYTKPFLHHLEALKIDHLGAVTPMVCAAYVATSKAQQKTTPSKGRSLGQAGLRARFKAVEALYELSQYTDDPIPQHPWPDTSARTMAGLTNYIQGSRTPLIPDDVFCTLFEQAYQQVERGQSLLELRDALETLAANLKGLSTYDICRAKNNHLETLGWGSGLNAFNNAMIKLRTSCYIVLASTSGCRNHELANLQLGAHHRTQDDEGNVYHWMRSRSDKTDTGIHDWMIPEAAVRALRMMERWAAPFQAMIDAEIAKRRRANPQDPEITEAQKHRHALFLRVYSNKGNQARTLSVDGWNHCLKAFVKDCGLRWNLASHQFRRKFANYAAHSRFGDLRYLKEHFAHWSLDMTLSYAIDDSWFQHLDLELYTDIQLELEDIKLSVVDNWLSDTHLAGGYGRSIKQWQREPKNLLIFKDRASMLKSIAESTAIRSNGHAWCTADNDGCVGNTLERTRCGNCNNAVIGPGHTPIYQRLYDDLKGLLDCPDIGQSGRRRVERDLSRCRDVLAQLGINSEALIA
ncbi:TPA: tyrosine-type recombinase/integrase [Pseudomonas aeruginosa]|uniref:tyrosine-type recombinase/integrase n=1 Tax=Pseudomonas aeruginosa TaxID=287 RepID=UPI0010688FAE|nr:tyrosine-type recombinase/integrase [Pseudomonas aeruginosa]MBY9591290.1 tyrosine-type recombinase/integrase [Pseudomonas aeruginosa]MBY9642788.1 tyrosine-type recombinase/integrase [Pseudomonas aeruginosa]QZV41520.1 tyrosine-type recombinase/integrase [Pseudomonas aeruginosa]TEB92434.1 integrase [Pseudomonas aeruginosa]HCI1891379.1 tyrosine-type recombinase/integrase [Pseudomonas aeruginosa]